MGESAALEAFIGGATRLPVMPQATIRLLEALDSPNSSSRDVAAIVESEPVLAARLLKLANSSFYGQRGRIARVHNAVVVLGAKTIRSLALAVWTHTLRGHGGGGESALLATLLAHGLFAGVTARLVSAAGQPALAEEAFMGGLLHDIGRVALIAQLGAEYRQRILDPAQAAPRALHEQEIAELGFDHRALGAALLTRWGLPGFLAEVALRHHDADVQLDPPGVGVLAAVALADRLAGMGGFVLGAGLPRPDPGPLAAAFGLADPAAIADFIRQCALQAREMSERLD